MKNTCRNIFLTGGTGFIGTRLTQMLIKRGHRLVIATRHPERYANTDRIKHVLFSRDSSAHFEEVLSGCDVVINLAGESLFGKRWTPAVKKRLYDSRVETTRMLVEAMEMAEKKPELFVSCSAAGYYGNRGDLKLAEHSEPGSDFLAMICRDWEKASAKATEMSVRVVNPRIGIALGAEGGALSAMLPVFRSYLGGSIGHGSQYFPWIHIRDLCHGLLYLMDNEQLEGPFNISAPNPVTMDEFSGALGRALGRPSIFRVPEWALKGVLGEASAMLTGSLRMIPKGLQEAGFVFEHDNLDSALKDLFP